MLNADSDPPVNFVLFLLCNWLFSPLERAVFFFPLRHRAHLCLHVQIYAVHQGLVGLFCYCHLVLKNFGSLCQDWLYHYFLSNRLQRFQIFSCHHREGYLFIWVITLFFTFFLLLLLPFLRIVYLDFLCEEVSEIIKSEPQTFHNLWWVFLDIPSFCYDKILQGIQDAINAIFPLLRIQILVTSFSVFSILAPTFCLSFNGIEFGFLVVFTFPNTFFGDLDINLINFFKQAL